jgi:hypothetical protein
MRIDPASELGGLRWNQWVALAMIVIGAVVLVVRRGPGPVPEPVEPVEPVEPAEPGALDADAGESSDYVPQDE